MTAPMREIQTKFPKVICWDPRSRREVMNTIALDVKESVFKATHHPSFLQQEGAAAETFVPIPETEFLNDFLNPDHPHVFNVAVGDPGTGKSHLIRWMHHETQNRNAAPSAKWHILIIPRSSSNLTEIVLRILEGFKGEIVNRLKAELDSHRAIPFEEAKGRILDELAIVIERRASSAAPSASPVDEADRTVLELLPSFLKDIEIQRPLSKDPNGIVARLATHVLGQRTTVLPEGSGLAWKPDDLVLPEKNVNRAGTDARSLGAQFNVDEKARRSAARFLNEMSSAAFNNLLRFRSGDVKGALEEIRGILHERGQELVLFIEDLSVTEGIDAELIEALQVRTRDTGRKLCRLRSVVGVTPDDFGRLRKNIKDRIHQTVFFNMTLHDHHSVGLGSVGHEDIVAFAARYLTATRYTLDELDAWLKAQHSQELPTICSRCVNREECHRAFGQYDGHGLYPFTREALVRLYDYASSSSGSEPKAFNPRLLVGKVLSVALGEAENTIPNGTFPSESFAQNFRLRSLQDVPFNKINHKYGSRAGQVQRTIELYSPNPSSITPTLDNLILQSLGGPELDWGGDVVPPPSTEPETSKTERDKTTEKSKADQDAFNRWFQGGRISDREINKWRQAVHDALVAHIDWDSQGLVKIRKESFKSTQINFEDQHVTEGRGDVVLNIKRSAESSITLRNLIEGISGVDRVADAEGILETVRDCLDQWGKAVLGQTIKVREAQLAAKTLDYAAQVLCFGALFRGGTPATLASLVAAALEPWPQLEPTHRSPSWSALWKAFQRWQPTLKTQFCDVLSCTKGGSDYSRIIDPTPLFAAAEKIIGQGIPDTPPDGSDGGLLKEAGRLGSDINRHAKKALGEEKEQAHKWKDSLSSFIGIDGFEAVFETVREAIRNAAMDSLLDSAGSPGDIGKSLETFDSTRFRQAVSNAEAVIGAKKPSDLLLAIARMDSNFMSESLDSLGKYDHLLERSVEKAKRKLNSLGTGESPAELKEQIRNNLNELIADVKAIAENLAI